MRLDTSLILVSTKSGQIHLIHRGELVTVERVETLIFNRASQMRIRQVSIEAVQITPVVLTSYDLLLRTSRVVGQEVAE